jgi:hypothetical protein
MAAAMDGQGGSCWCVCCEHTVVRGVGCTPTHSNRQKIDIQSRCFKININMMFYVGQKTSVPSLLFLDNCSPVSALLPAGSIGERKLSYVRPVGSRRAGPGTRGL